MRVGDHVRLVRPHRDLPSGAEGLVVEFYRRPRDELVAVRFDGRSELVPIDSLVVETTALPEEWLAPG
jgi:hypothetical protein